MDLEVTGWGVRRVLIAVAVLAAVGLVAGYGVARRGTPESTVIKTKAATSSAPSVRLLFVHVAGAVGSPGLFQLPVGARVDDAIKAAGGAAPDADLATINLAAKVRDGDKISVPKQGQAQAGSAAAGGGGAGAKVNLNLATIAELDALPGVGPSTAQKIIDFRTSFGAFRAPEDLMKVPGIGKKKFEQLSELVTV